MPIPSLFLHPAPQHHLSLFHGNLKSGVFLIQHSTFMLSHKTLRLCCAPNALLGIQCDILAQITMTSILLVLYCLGVLLEILRLILRDILCPTCSFCLKYFLRQWRTDSCCPFLPPSGGVPHHSPQNVACHLLFTVQLGSLCPVLFYLCVLSQKVHCRDSRDLTLPMGRVTQAYLLTTELMNKGMVSFLLFSELVFIPFLLLLQ